MGKLNAKQVETLALPGTYEDGEGLRLVVKTSTRKSWVLRYQLVGRRREMGIGAYPAVSLKQARLTAAAHKAQLLSGVDPLEQRNNEKAAKKQAQRSSLPPPTFKNVALEYIETHRSGWKNQKHAKQWESTLETYVYPTLGNISPADIKTEQILATLKPIWQAKPETAARVRNRIEMVLDAAKAMGFREGENVARWRGHLDKLLPPRSKMKPVKHHPALPWSEIPAFMKTLRSREDFSFKAMIMTILTACRTSEVLAARWEEIDMTAATWKIPAHRMKAGREHRVPLSKEMLALLASLIRVHDNPYLFPSVRSGKHLSNMSMLMALRRMNREDLTMHGFRSTFRDWAAESTNHPREVCEQALAHVRLDKTEAAYFRGDMFDKRRALMEDWARFTIWACEET